MNDRVQMIRDRLNAALDPEKIDIEDDSARHAGHVGAKSGGGHFNLHIVSDRFEGMSLIERHRAVYAAMGDAMQSEIHALSIDARTPAEEQAD